MAPNQTMPNKVGEQTVPVWRCCACGSISPASNSPTDGRCCLFAACVLSFGVEDPRRGSKCRRSLDDKVVAELRAAVVQGLDL